MNRFFNVSNLYFSYDKKKENEEFENFVLKKLNFTVEKGEHVAIVGANGCGKSTLSKLLNAILTPTKGVVLVKGIKTSNKETIYEIRKNVGLIFQDADNQIVATIVEEDVAFALENLCVPQKDIEEIVNKSLESVGMLSFKKSMVENLSGGQKSKIAIAGILAMQPECIIFDEATAMLDPKSRKEVLKIIKDLNKNKGITIVNITHNMKEVCFADRVIVLKDGQVLKEGKPKEIFSDDLTLKEAKLCLPQLCELIKKLNEKGLVKEKVAINFDECVEILVGSNLLKGE